MLKMLQFKDSYFEAWDLDSHQTLVDAINSVNQIIISFLER
jgi:hypothetical protein